MTIPRRPADGVLKIRFDCACGKRLAAMPESAGQHVTCPACGRSIVIPGMSPAISIPTPAEETAPPSRAILAISGGVVGVFVLAAIVFLVWWSASHKRAHIAASNKKVEEAVSAATEWIAHGKLEDADIVEGRLASALNDPRITDKRDGDKLVEQMRQRRQALGEEMKRESKRLAELERNKLVVHRQDAKRLAELERQRLEGKRLAATPKPDDRKVEASPAKMIGKVVLPPQSDSGLEVASFHVKTRTPYEFEIAFRGSTKRSYSKYSLCQLFISPPYVAESVAKKPAGEAATLISCAELAGSSSEIGVTAPGGGGVSKVGGGEENDLRMRRTFPLPDQWTPRGLIALRCELFGYDGSRWDRIADTGVRIVDLGAE